MHRKPKTRRTLQLSYIDSSIKRTQVPTEWDDIYPSNIDDKCWKRHRKYQARNMISRDTIRHPSVKEE